MVRLSRARLPLTVALLLLGAARAPAQEDAPADTLPGEVPADTVAAAPGDSAGARPGPAIVLPGVEIVEEEPETGLPWEVDPAGFRGVTLERYDRVDGAVPGFGGALVPRDPDRWPRVEARIGFATTRRRIYGRVGVAQRLPGAGKAVARLGIAWFHRPATFDDWKLAPRENDFATFLVGSDQMDWWRERGWRVALSLESDVGDRSLEVSLLDVEQFSEESRSPFVLFGDGDFRDNPAIDAGRLRSATVRYVHDTRDVQSPLLPAAGWIVALETETAVDAFGADRSFLRGMAEVRRYLRIGRDAWWDHRWVVHAGRDLPAQRRPVLGGPGSLRGFPAASFVGDETAVQGSSELRLPLPVTDWIAPVFLSWHAVAFADAGTVDPDLGTWHADAGVGISGISLFSYLGVFVAQRVTDLDAGDAGPRAIVRLRRDF